MNIEGKLSIRIDMNPNNSHQVDIDSSRPVHASGMFEGKPVEQVLQLLPLVFSVCGVAQGCAGVRACESALGLIADDGLERRREQLAGIETLREHLWQVFLRWPPFAGRAEERSALAEIMAIQRGWSKALSAEDGIFLVGKGRLPQRKPTELQPLNHRLATLLEESVFSMPPARWLEIERRDELEIWMGCRSTVAAAYLDDIARKGWASIGNTPMDALLRMDEALLREHMQEKTFIAAPTWEGSCHETSVTTRTRSPLLEALRETYGNGLLVRLVARLTEVAQLAGALAEDEPTEISDTPAGKGLGQVQAARGLLVHAVEVDDQAVIQRYRILAPTEWNFHPDGVVAHSLAVLEGDEAAVEAQAHHLIQAIDPCVGYDLRVESTKSAH